MRKGAKDWRLGQESEVALKRAGLTIRGERERGGEESNGVARAETSVFGKKSARSGAATLEPRRDLV